MPAQRDILLGLGAAGIGATAALVLRHWGSTSTSEEAAAVGTQLPGMRRKVLHMAASAYTAADPFACGTGAR